MAELGFFQEDVARVMGIHPATLSRFIKGRRRPPEGWEEWVHAALDLMERAEEAAEEARARVLAEGVAKPGDWSTRVGRPRHGP